MMVKLALTMQVVFQGVIVPTDRRMEAPTDTIIIVAHSSDIIRGQDHIGSLEVVIMAVIAVPLCNCLQKQEIRATTAYAWQ